MPKPTAYMVNDETLAAYGGALASLVTLMLSRLAREQPGASQRAAVAYRQGTVRLKLVTTLAYGAQHELVLSALDERGNDEPLATVVVNAAALD